jgi:hypothetical protein
MTINQISPTTTNQINQTHQHQISLMTINL